jgi:hypothetical protein
MRYIPLLETTPSQEWLDKAAAAAQEIENEAQKGNVKARNELIEKKDVIWKELRDWLLDLSNQKCWFSEAKDCFQDWDVEHYRPKKSAKNLDRSKRDGYWWLSLDWRNFRICGRVGNTKKGTFFPVNGFIADGNNRNTDDELPYLLDPIKKADCQMLSFNQLGEAIPAPGLDQWNSLRVRVSVQRYKLYHDKLELARQDIWDTCTSLVHEIQNLMLEQSKSPSATKRTRIEEKIEQLAAYTKRNKICSSTAIVCLQKSEIGWAVRLSAEAGP